MAITRCPYCHAITDENDKYCNNCGTQLLFSEDEQVEEEIPGEKIIDAEVEEKDYTIDEPEGEKRPAAAKDLDSEIDEELEEEIPEETEEMNLEELVDEEISAEKTGSGATEEVILVDEPSKSLDDTGKAGAKTPEPEAPKEEDEEDKDEDKDDDDDEDEEGKEAGEEEEEEEEELADELDEESEEEPVKKDGTNDYSAAAAPKEPKEEPGVEYISEIPAPDEAATAGEAGLRPVTFDTRELEDLGETVDLSKEKVDKFLEVMAEKKAPTPPAAPEPAPGKAPEPPTGTLPPWASTMKGAPVFPEDTGPVETRKLRGGEPSTPDTEEEVEIFPRRRAPDSTIGLPEKVSQAPLPFERPATEADEAEDEGEEVGVEEGEEEIDEAGAGPEEDRAPEAVVLPAGQVRPAREPLMPVREPDQVRAARREIEAAEEGRERGPRPPFNFSVFIKSKAFDILFVGIFWVVALWLAAYSMGMTLFDILGSMSGSMLLLY
ncbi:MAG: zinc ribbon domain-containing protein, partial [Candidatus Aminicenantes bacterium]